MLSIYLNFIIFQSAWFITILSAASGFAWLGPGFTFLWMLLHLAYVNERRLAELDLLIFAAISGYFLDSLLVLLSFITFPPQTALGAPSTLWMIALWINLAATLNVSLKWIHGNFILAALLGGIGGPLTYYAGSRLGALEINGLWSLLAISVEWLIAMPVLLWFAQRQSGNRSLQFLFNRSVRE